MLERKLPLGLTAFHVLGEGKMTSLSRGGGGAGFRCDGEVFIRNP
jgi:hypothetical protein